MELNFKNARTTFFRIQLVVGIFAFFVALVLIALIEPAPGEYLTKSAIESLRTNEILYKFFYAMMVIWIGMMLSCFATLYFGKNIIPISVIGLVVLVVMFFLIQAIPYIVHKPEVMKLTCVSGYLTHTGDEYSESFTHTLIFENGMKCRVSEKAYLYSIDNTYWVVVVGNKAVAAYKTEEYKWIEGY